MTDQSLRAALLKITGDLVARAEEGEPHLFLTVPLRDLEELLAVHPAHPAPVVTDEAVGAAYDAYVGDMGVSLHEGLKNALEAAAPLLGPRPLLDRESVTAAIRAEVASYGITPSTAEPKAVDAVMKLARTLPTREQIDSLLQEWRVRPSGQPTQQEAVNYRRKMRNALLALLNGAES